MRVFTVVGMLAGHPTTRDYPAAHGLSLRADTWGKPSDPPVIFMHGGGQTRHAWGNTAREVAENGFFSISLDLRGHGDSDWHDDGDYSIDAYADDLKEVVSAFDTAPVLVGASLGGLTALIAEGERHPGLARAVVFVDITPRMEKDGVDRIMRFMSASPDGFETVGDAADAVAEFLPHRPRPSDHSGLRKNLRRGPDGRYHWHWDPGFLTSRLDRPRDRTLEVEWQERLDNAARSLALPCMLVRGRMSDIVSEQGAREFCELVPHAEFVDVADAAHMVAGDKNDAFSAAVCSFLDSLTGGDGSRRSA